MIIFLGGREIMNHGVVTSFLLSIAVTLNQHETLQEERNHVSTLSLSIVHVLQSSPGGSTNLTVEFINSIAFK
jgi:hypothetical protein